MTRYTFTFDRSDERKFREVLSRLDETDYSVIEQIQPVKSDNQREESRYTVMDMDSDCALTFRLGMKQDALKIRRERTEEELAEEKALDDANTIKVVVHVPMGQ